MEEVNIKKLEEMRQTVDEMFHDTIVNHLEDSFKQVSEHLEVAHKGLREIQSFASRAGDI